MILCEYGCGLEATYQFKNGKWCCSDNAGKCPSVREKNITSNKSTLQYIKNQYPNFAKEEEMRYNPVKIEKREIQVHCKNSECENSKEKGGWFTPTHIQFYERIRQIEDPRGNDRGFIYCCKKCKEIFPNINIGKKRSLETRRNIGIAGRYTIEQYQEKYPTFCKEEEMRYNPDKLEEKEIQVHCKNNNCENSKEKGGWFTPTRIQLYERVRQVESLDGNDGSYFYCSQHCKDTCPLYNSRGNDPFKVSIEQAYRSKVWNDQVLKQDESTCQICGSKENLHCHHIEPVKLEPEYSLDPTNGIVLCQICHIKYGHKKGTECSLSSLAKKKCKNSKNQTDL